MKTRIIGFILILAAIVIGIVSVIQYGPRLRQYRREQADYKELQDEYTKDPEKIDTEEYKPETDEEGSETDQEKSSIDKSKETSKHETSVYVSLMKELGMEDKINDYAPIEVDGKKLKEKNPDYIGWIYVPGTDISYPVVKSSDNQDYVHTNFNRQYSYAGTIFMDSDYKGNYELHNTVLYGHNMNDGSMFAQLKGYFKEEFAKSHPIFWFITPEETRLYRVFSVSRPYPTDKNHYAVEGTDYNTTEEFGTIVQNMIKDSIYDFWSNDVNGNSVIMGLSTCISPSTEERCMVEGVFVGKL